MKFSELTYPVRKVYYRARLFKRFLKHNYWGAWEMVEPMMQYPFEMLCEFVEQGGLEGVDCSEGCWKTAKDEMDYLYKWWTEIKKQREEELKTLLDEWANHHVSWWQRCVDGEYYSYEHVNTKYTDYLFKLLDEEEQKFEKEKEENLIRLMKIRNYLWT